MSLPASALVNWSAVWKIVLVAFIGGGGVAIAFGLALLGVERARTAGRGRIRLAHWALAGSCGLFCVGAVAIGILAMTDKPSSKAPPKPAGAVGSAASQRGTG